VGNKIVKHNQPCLNPKCTSSNGMQVYEAGDATCFVCMSFFSKDEVDAGGNPDSFKVTTTEVKEVVEQVITTQADEIRSYPISGLRDRLITKEICEFFGVHVSYNNAGEVDTHYYPYGEGFNIRYVKDKKFSRVGELTQMFGQDKFSKGGKRLVICEGEPDVMSVAYASKKKWNVIYPVVTMGSATNVTMLLNHREWIRSFDEVVLWFDNDEAGQEALKKAIHIVGVDKAKIAVHGEYKDANEVHIKAGFAAILNTIFDAQRYVPSGIISKEDLRRRMKERALKPAIPYPPCLEGVNGKLKGKRLGEITMLVSGTGSGKSTIVREDILFTLDHTPDDVKIGVLALEESPEETGDKLVGMWLKRNPTENEITEEDKDIAFEAIFGNDRILLLDHQGSINDTSIVDLLEYMCLMGCQYIYIDHITILVSEGVEKLTGNEAQDKMMNDLLRLVKRHPVWIGVISHLRKTQGGGPSFEEGKLPSMDDIRGSGSLKQIAFDIIAFARNMRHKVEEKRNLIRMEVLKARTTGRTGPVIGAVYDPITGRLSAADESSLNDDEENEEQFTKVETAWVKK